MRIILQALASSLLVHIVYILCMLAVGLAQTYLYKPQFAPNELVLQNEIAFGYVVKFPYLGMSFVIVAMLMGLVFIVRSRKQKLS